MTPLPLRAAPAPIRSINRKCATMTTGDLITILRLLRDGMAPRKIAGVVGFSQRTIYRVRAGWRPRTNPATGRQIHARIEVWRVREMCLRGMAPSAIARALDVAKWSINRVINRHDLLQPEPNGRQKCEPVIAAEPSAVLPRCARAALNVNAIKRTGTPTPEATSPTAAGPYSTASIAIA